MNQTESKNINELPDEAFLRLKRVLELIPISTSSWYAGIKEGRYPASVALSSHTRGWRVREIKGLLQKIERGEMQ